MNKQVIIVDYYGHLVMCDNVFINKSIIQDEETMNNISILRDMFPKLWNWAYGRLHQVYGTFFEIVKDIYSIFDSGTNRPLILDSPDIFSAYRLKMHKHPEHKIEVELFVTMENGQVRKILMDRDGKFTDTPENMTLYNEWEKPYFDFISQCLDI